MIEQLLARPFHSPEDVILLSHNIAYLTYICIMNNGMENV